MRRLCRWSLARLFTVAVAFSVGFAVVAAESDIEVLREAAVTALGDDAASLWPRLGEELRAAIGRPDALDRMSRQLRQQYGREKELLDESLHTQSGMTHYRRVARYERSELLLATALTVDAEGVIQGLAITLEQPAPDLPPGLPELPAGSLPPSEWIETMLKELVGVSLPAVIVGVRDAAGRRVIAAGDAGDGEPPDKHTFFEAGSITKGLTGLLLAEMIASGDVTADQTLASLMPSDIALSPALADITLAELATHRSGLPRLGAGPDMQRRLATDNPYAGSTAEEVFRDVARVRESTIEQGRGQYLYSNLGTALLGQLLARVADQSYEFLLKERVFEPLQLGGLALAQADVAERERLAVGSLQGVPTTPWRMDAYAPAGGWQTNVEQLLDLGERLLRQEPAWVADALQPLYRDDSGGIGLAWMHGRVGDREFIWHNGATGGFSGYLAIVPEEALVLVVLANGASGVDAIAEALLAAGH
ncbi:hypothetical protein CAI21_15750 [Alkalilimnicola ehrlichii]|uniref:Beta-lactamase-related domain-containing protein n=1 Tax=Alkalilimnicola ehrlichii TaxID=351052 RepID=A0A3E0WQ59_9GAMM|nr:serine hydrolase [Alkalilimnicola ehrlichii]RFA27005.1 hypothetical protein CAI21_15750 [Alkalilimnicola ehrlichii]RFA34126.1 hypothetical protein CAL65_15885 [Alkalilimnicola ehrlichii]